MGVGSLYFFKFKVGEKINNNIAIAEVEKLAPEEFNGLEPLKRLWQRIWNEKVEVY
jgi:hypothetical protein